LAGSEALANFRFACRCWWRSLAVDGGSGACLLADNLPGGILETLLGRHRAMRREFVDEGRKLLSQMAGDVVRAQAHRPSHLLQLVVTKPAGHLLAVDHLID